MSKHTPGPWNVSGDMVTAGPDETDVAQVWSLDDVHLIAAAPDLLEAASLVFEEGYPHRVDASLTVIPSSVVEALRAAIAKADRRKA